MCQPKAFFFDVEVKKGKEKGMRKGIFLNMLERLSVASSVQLRNKTRFFGAINAKQLG